MNRPDPANRPLDSATAEALRQSEAKYRSLFESMNQGFCLVELLYDDNGKAMDYRFVEVNPVFEQQTGYVGAKGKRATELAPNVGQAWIDTVDSVARTGEPVRIDAFFDDPARWYAISMSRLDDASSPLVASVFDDITDRKRYEQQQAYMLALSDALRSIADPVAIEETVTQLAMQQFAADRCYYCRIEDGKAIITRDSVRGDLPSVAGTYPLSSFVLLKNVVDAGKPFIVDDAATTPILNEAIRAICLQLQVISFMNVPVIKNGQAVGVLCTVQSTPRHWTEAEIQLAVETAERIWAAVERSRAEEALKGANRRKDEFLAMLAHELRNPMATLHNTILLLMMTHGQDESLPIDKALLMMSREVTHLNRIVDDLLDVSWISQGKILLKKERLDLKSLVEDSLDGARSQFVRRNQTLTLRLPNRPIWVDGDQTRLTQVVRNLVTNAVNYTPPGGQIEVSLKKAGRQVELRIRDSGIGIPADQLQAIFEVFVQVSSSLDRPQGGLGLGLAVVKQLIELHGGQVGVYSAGLDQGSEFIVSLPLLPDASPASTSIDAGPASQPGRILVVDDNADLAITMAMLLRVKKYEAHTCQSGAEALNMVVSLRPDAVLLDLGMPDMDGYETCRRLREIDWGKHGVIVALSGYGQEEDKLRTSKSGFDGHLVKPVNLQTLTALLNKLLNQSGN